jgi:hypothetical protein
MGLCIHRTAYGLSRDIHHRVTPSGDVITIRPELRFERSYDTPAYDGGTKENQFTAAMDVIVHY